MIKTICNWHYRNKILKEINRITQEIERSDDFIRECEKDIANSRAEYEIVAEKHNKSYSFTDRVKFRNEADICYKDFENEKRFQTCLYEFYKQVPKCTLIVDDFQPVKKYIFKKFESLQQI